MVRYIVSVELNEDLAEVVATRAGDGTKGLRAEIERMVLDGLIGQLLAGEDPACLKVSCTQGPIGEWGPLGRVVTGIASDSGS